LWALSFDSPLMPSSFRKISGVMRAYSMGKIVTV
jgi:hypothetical protein